MYGVYIGIITSASQQIKADVPYCKKRHHRPYHGVSDQFCSHGAYKDSVPSECNHSEQRHKNKPGKELTARFHHFDILGKEPQHRHACTIIDPNKEYCNRDTPGKNPLNLCRKPLTVTCTYIFTCQSLARICESVSEE
jgi:hypothetical protein